MTEVHSCSYYCDRPECIKAQRDELRDRLGSMTDRELMQQALEGLEKWRWGDDPRSADDYITALRERLAQPEQEPVATEWERVARVQDAKLRAMCDEPGGFEKLCEVMDRYEHTSPPASKPWVGLTEQEPVATLDDLEQEIYENTRQFVSRDVMEWMLKRYYTTPPQRKPLTHPQIHELDWPDGVSFEDILPFVRAIEAAHGIKGKA